MKQLHYLKIYKRFVGAIFDGVMSFEQVEKIAQLTWRIEQLTKQK